MGTVAKVTSIAPIGFDGNVIEVESDLKNGLPSLQIVGLGNKAIDEAKERVRSAVSNSLLNFPSKKIVINLAPAELPKDGTHFDLPIAIAILVSSGQLKQSEVNNAVFVGELALDGGVRPVKGILSIVETSKRIGVRTVYVPAQNSAQAKLIDDITIIGVHSLKQLFLHLKGEVLIENQPDVLHVRKTPGTPGSTLDDIYGQEQAKRAIIIAAAGKHNILLTGSPGAGKTMLANTLTSILPPLSNTEKIAATKLASLAGETVENIVDDRPFRTPHHTSSRIALIGGGTKPKPGEISLAHLGVLFLDEIPEYSRATLEALRQPLEDKKISISRANGHVEYPADFLLVATMNPCPCGYYGDTARECTCTSTQVLSYQSRLSGPLLDRIDLIVTVPRVASHSLLEHNSLTSSQQNYAQKLVSNATKTQHHRYKSSDKYNSSLSTREIKQKLALSPDVRQFLNSAVEKLGLSARGYFKIIKVARTIADIDASKDIHVPHVAEALQYRQLTS